MQKFIFFFALTLVLCLISCSDNGCEDDVLGTYIGVESCGISMEDIEIIISSSTEDNEVIFTTNGSTLTWNASLSSNCDVFTVSSQSGSVNGEILTFEGLFNLNGDILTGSRSFSNGTTCLYNFTRQL